MIDLENRGFHYNPGTVNKLCWVEFNTVIPQG